MSRTLEQIRAAHAYQKVQQLKEQPDEWRKNYVSYIEGLPASILANGLGQTLATLMARGSEAHMVLYRHLEEWLCRQDDRAPYLGENDLMGAITAHDRNKYMHAQAEAMEWLSWAKKFAVAILKPPEKPNPERDGK